MDCMIVMSYEKLVKHRETLVAGCHYRSIDVDNIPTLDSKLTAINGPSDQLALLA
jgi:hypothetical protein